jgi:two-component system sensor histidine kinase CiaH
MFTRIGRQLAILNTVVVALVILLVGLASYLALQRSLNREADQSLRDRIASIQSTSNGLNRSPLTGGSALRIQDEDRERDDEEETEDEDREIVASGDTVLLIVNESGTIVDNPRGVDLQDLPVMDGIDVAMEGQTDARTVTLSDGEEVRVMTAPLFVDGRIIGAVQAVRSLGEHQEQLEIVRRMTLLGIGIGLVVAAPAGYYLSRRAMIPINQAFDGQRAFAADASHELRTPLTLIRANAEFGLSEPGGTDPGTRASLMHILQEVDKTDRQVDDLLLLARLDAGELPLDLKYHEMVRVVCDEVASMRPAADRQQIELACETTTDAVAALDSDRIQQVIRIVLDNALKHTEASGRIAVRVGDDGSNGIITIEDSGAGIPDEHLLHIFERFYRVDKSRSRASGGTGLGLSIARQIVQAHGGQISITSAAGQGTTVTIQLPII